MGASSWRYYTPYRDDPEAALQELRRRVFAEGDYSMGCGGFSKVDQPGGGGGGGFPGGGFPGMRNPMDMIRSGAFGPLDPVTARVLRAAESGDFSELAGPERQAAEQMRAVMRLFPGAGIGGASGPRLHDPDDDEPGDDDRPGSIEELLETVAEDGTHSVLDIEGISPRPTFGAATPLGERHYEKVFGSARPTHDQVERRWARLSDRLERWHAYCVTVYDAAGRPTEYAFIGCSGD